MSDLVKKIELARKRLAEGREEKARLEGRYDQLRKRLSDEFGLESMDVAEAELEKLGGEVEELNTKLAGKAEELDALMEDA